MEESSNPATGPGPKSKQAKPQLGGAFSQMLKEQLDPLQPVMDDGFLEDRSKQDHTQSRILDAAKYRPYIKNLHIDDDNLDRQRAEGQSGLEQAGHALAQFGGQFLGGVAMSAGTSTDIEQSINVIKGTEKEYGNALFNWGKKFIEKTAEANPIYEKNPGSVSPSDSGWWASMVANTGLSAGIMGYSMAETALISSLTEGGGLGVELAASAKRLRNIKSLGTLLEAGDASSKLRRAATMFGVINRHHEGVMEAADAFQTEYEFLKNKKGFTEEDAREGAAKAGAATYAGNLPLMALDIMQFRAMTFNPVSGASGGGLVEGLLSKVKNPKLAKGIGHVLGMASEGAEEFWQALVQDEAKNYADTASGVGSGADFKDRFKKLTDQGEIWNASISGVFGGALLGGASHLFQKATESGARKQLNRDYDDFVKNISGMGTEMVNNIRQAEDSGNVEHANNLRRSMGINKALTAVHLDNLKDSDTAFTSYHSYMSNLLEAANSNDAAQLEELGLAGQQDFIKANVPNYIKDAEEIQTIYDGVKQRAKRDAIIPITHRTFLQNNLASRANELQSQIAEVENSMPDLANVSSPARTMNDALIQIEIGKASLPQLRDRLKSTGISQVQRDGINAQILAINFSIDHNQKIVDDQKAQSESLSEAQKTLDADILDSVNKNAQLYTLRKNKNSIDNQLAGVRKELRTWNDPQFQNKTAEMKLLHIVDAAETIEELQEAQRNMIQQGIYTDVLRKNLESKLKTSVARVQTEALANNNPITPVNNPTPEQAPSAFSQTMAKENEPTKIPQATVDNPFEGIPPAPKTSPERQQAASNLFTVSKSGATVINSNPFEVTPGNVTAPVTSSESGPSVNPLDNSERASQATVVTDADDFFEPAPISDNLTEEQKQQVKDRLSDYYNSLAAELGKKPTFKELVEDMIENTSAEAVDKNFNVISLGWTLNDYPTTNFQKVYNELFGTRKSKANDFFAFAEQSILSEPEFKQESEQQNEKELLEQAPAAQIAETETGQKVLIKNTTEFQTVESTLKFAHLSQTYDQNISTDGTVITVERSTNTEELAQNKFVDSRELMNPNLYGAGTKLSVKVPETMGEVVISTYSADFQTRTSIPFEQWAKDKDPNSDEYIGRVPMIIYNADGKGVAFIHDVEWYNPINVGFGEDPNKQAKIIADSRAELLAFRKAVLAGQASSITITEKRPGTKIVIPKSKPTITIMEANPQAQIGFANDLGNIVVGNEVISFDSLMNASDLKIGHRYDVRQAGLKPDGSKLYIASPVQYEVLDDSAKTSVINAIRVYMTQSDNEERVGKKQDIENIRSRVKSQSGLDLFNQADLESYLGLFIQTYKGKAKTNIDIANDINSRSEVVNGTPWMAISQGRLVFGIKGVKLSQSEANGFTMYMHPDNLKKDNAATAASITLGNMQRLFKPDYLGAMKQNLSQEHLISNTPVSLIGPDYQNASAVPYQEHVKSKFKTNLRSIRLEDGAYTSFTQPVIHFTYENQPASITPSGAEVKVNPISIVQAAASETTGNPVIETEASLIKSIMDAMPDFENLGLTPEAMQALKNLGTGNETLFDPDYASLTDDIVKSIKVKLTKIEDLDTIDRNTVVQFIANQVMTKINPQDRNSLSKAGLITEVNKSFNDIVSPKVKTVDAHIETLRKLLSTNPSLAPVVSQFENLRANADVLRKNWNFLINEAFEDYIEKFTGISVTMSRDKKTVDVAIKDDEAAAELTQTEDDQQEFSIESSDQREKDYSKESVEDNGKNSVSYLTKRFLAQIPSFDNNGNPKKGYMGITTYPGFDFYYDAIGKILSSPSPVDSNINDVIIRLEEHKDGKPWVAEVIKRLKEADEQLQNAFLYNFSRETLSMKFVMYSFDQKTGNYKLKVYDTNANEINRVIQNQWRENFKQSGLSILSGEGYAVNKVKAQELLNKFLSWTTTGPLPTVEQAQAWLSEFGIELSTDSMKELFTNGYYVTENKKPVQYPYAKMFTKSDKTNGVFGLLARKLELMIHTTNPDYQDNDSINPFDDASGILTKLSNIESKYSTNVTTNSFRDGSKSIFGYTPSKFATSFLNMLKSDPSILEGKSKIAFDQNSFLLGLLQSDAEFSSKFQIDHLGINAFKELGKKLYQDNTINSLADADHELVKLGMFQDMQQGEVKSTTPNGLPLRVARMFFPTMSDKSAMLDVSTAVLKLDSKHFSFNEDGSLVIDQKVKDFLFSQTIEPELKRIIAHHAKAKSLGVHPNAVHNQKGYNLGAQIFNMMPAMNNVMMQTADGPVRLIEYLANSAGMLNENAYEGLKNSIMGDVNILIDNMYGVLANGKLESWEKSGYLEKTPTGELANVKFLNSSYINKMGLKPEEAVKIAALDFVINSALTNANMHMLFIGDVANYSQDKAFKNNVERDADGNVLAYKPVADSVYADMSANVVSVNLGKRLALMIAPGSTLAQSKNDKYVQLFLQDRTSMAENIDFLIELYHGKEALAEVQGDLNTIRASNDEKANKQLIAKVAKKFPDLGAYFDIESTDGQEYTTIKEHLDVLYRQGRVSTEQYTEFKEKISAQREAESKGLPIPLDAILSDEKLKVIFQPIKPVYTGQLNDTKNGVSRMVYIKTSSFPLLPQMTTAFPNLDRLRRKMEELEGRVGRNVRATYDTGSKVGSPMAMNQLKLWDEKGNFIEDSFNVDDIASKIESGDDTSALILDRKFFRIQQDVPFKSTKIDHQDSITLGTQMMKLIMGDGIGQMAGNIFSLGNRQVSGPELQNHYNAMFNSWIASEKSKLYSSLGIDEATGEAIDPTKTAQKLQNILQQEAKKRGYPKQDVEALEVEANGQFTLPLWLSPNSNRYEAMLNAIVTNRLLNLKLPGASFVVGSEEGFNTFQLQDDLSGIDQSKIIFTSKWTGELKGVSKSGLAQIIVPSKFRDKTGKLLDLFKKVDGEYLYVTQRDNGTYMLKEDMIDPALMSNSTFRIPTSSHVSLSQVEIVGILPVESGDLMILPKNFTKQKGIDFDVDKENMYMLHHFIDESGKVMSIEHNPYGATYDSIKDDIQGAEEYLEHMKTLSAESREMVQNYQDELEALEELGMADFDRKHIRGLMKDAKYAATMDKSTVKSAVRVVRELKDLETKLYQNEIVKSYSAVLGSTHPEVQKKINKVLSTDFAESQAELIDGMIKQDQDNSNFTILSDEYQKFKMSLGAAGKLGIGVYSNYVVLHSLIQQSPQPITLMAQKWVDDQLVPIPFELNLGGIQSNGRLGGMMTLDGGRSITDVNAERQNTATDNEKLQIMGKTNINEITINVDALMSIMGFDKTKATIDGKEQEISIPYMLMSQPIMRDYVAEIRNTRSNIAGYNPEADIQVYKKLADKYSFKLDMKAEEMESHRIAMTGQALVDGIATGGVSGANQQVVLELFMELNKFAEDISSLQSKLNIQRSGLGKSIFEMIGKYNNVAKLEDMKSISNIKSLVGDYISGESFFGYTKEELVADGYTVFDDNKNAAPFAVKPTTVTGSLVVHSAKAGFELWSDFFPHQNPVVMKTVDEAIKALSKQDATETKQVQLQHEIFEEMKKYLFSSGKIGIFKGNPQEERQRLFFDKGPEQQSLASYLKNFIKSDHENAGLVAANKLITRFQYQLEQGNMPSLIKYDNGKSEDFNEEYKYSALVELMDKNIPLANYNGQPYTSRMLAKDLITYSYLQGGIQHAIEFVKYVPVGYLKEMGFADATQRWQEAANGKVFTGKNGDVVDMWSAMLGNNLTNDDTVAASRFVMQFLQHNAQRLPKLTEADMELPQYKLEAGEQANLSALMSFKPKQSDAEIAPFVAVYNKAIPKGKSKFQMYAFNGREYNRVSTLGVFGLSEYDVRSNDVTPLIDNHYGQSPMVAKISPATSATTVTNVPYSIEKNNLSQTLTEIVEANIPGTSAVAKALLPFMDNSVQVVVTDVNGGKSSGSYLNGVISIDKTQMSKPGATKEKVAKTLVHEYVHALTSKVLNKHFTKEGVAIDPSNLPANMKRLQRLFQEVQKTMEPELEQFKQWYATHPGQLRTADDRILYAGMNIHEFTAMVMSEPDVQKRMSEIPYMQTGKTLLEQFVEAIKKVLVDLGINMDSNTVTSEAMSTIFEIIQEQNPAAISQNPNSLTSFGSVITPADEDLGKILDEEDKLDEEGEDFLEPAALQEELDKDCLF